MLQPLLMVCFLAVFLRDAFDRPWLGTWVGHGAAAVISLASMACIAIVTHVLIWRNGRRLSRTGNWREVHRADLTVGGAWVAATVAHVFNVLALGWLDAVRSVVGDVIVLDEVVAVLPVVAVIIAGWWSLYPIDRKVREAGLLRDLDLGHPVYPQVTRGGFMLMAVRHHLAIVLVPVLLVMSWSEIVEWAAGRWFGVRLDPTGQTGGAGPLVVVLVQAVGALGVFTALPPIMRRLWDTEPLGASGIRERLDALCRRHGVRNRELLVWKTQGTMINGAVMGLLAPVRYILLTDSLLDHLTDSQIEAVMAHEVGHVRWKHIIWLVVGVLAALGCSTLAAGLALEALPPSVSDWAAAPAMLAAAGAAIIMFGFASRRFEWQADAFAARHLSLDSPGVPRTITPEAVSAMTGALQAVADLNHIPPDRFGWRHGSILTRQRKLRALIGLPLDGLPIDKQARVIKIVTALGLLVVVIAAVASAVIEPSSDNQPPSTDTMSQ